MQQPASHSPLLTPAGLHNMQWHQFKALILRDPTPRRQQLWEGLAALVSYLHSADMQSLEVWLDGSLVTAKPVPRDTDMVVWLPRDQLNSCPPSTYAKIERLLDRKMVRQKYLVDLYFGDPDSREERQYWEALFSRCQTGVEKGFAQVML